MLTQEDTHTRSHAPTHMHILYIKCFSKQYFFNFKVAILQNKKHHQIPLKYEYL